MIRAERFTPNPATAADNAFQADAPAGQSDDATSAMALAEMDALAGITSDSTETAEAGEESSAS